MRLLNRVLKGFGLVLLLGALAFFLWPEKAYEAYQVSPEYQAQVDAFHLGNGKAAKATLIIIPGYTATMSMYGEHVDMLARRGYHVIGIDMRGQGGSERHRTSQPEKLWVDDFKDYSDDLAAFVKGMKIGNRFKRIYLRRLSSFVPQIQNVCLIVMLSSRVTPLSE